MINTDVDGRQKEVWCHANAIENPKRGFVFLDPGCKVTLILHRQNEGKHKGELMCKFVRPVHPLPIVERHRGVIKMYEVNKKYGFIEEISPVPNSEYDPTDIFFMHSSFGKDAWLREGMIVEFSMGKQQKREAGAHRGQWHAIDANVVEDPNERLRSRERSPRREKSPERKRTRSRERSPRPSQSTERKRARSPSTDRHNKRSRTDETVHYGMVADYKPERSIGFIRPDGAHVASVFFAERDFRGRLDVPIQQGVTCLAYKERWNQISQRMAAYDIVVLSELEYRKRIARRDERGERRPATDDGHSTI